MKRIAIVLSIMLLAISCRSTDGTKYTEGEIRNALMSLSSDMFSSVDLDSPVGIDRIISALPPTYSAYSRYVPLYEDIAEEYAEHLSGIISPYLPDAIHEVREAASSLAETGSDAFIYDDRSFTEGIRSRIYQSVTALYSEELEAVSDELSAAFQPSSSEFQAVRGAYLNLSAVGHATYISPPEMIDPERAACILADTLFDRLGECERALKNSPSGITSGYYYVFWGGR